jgi:myo-inositol-1(or 4)-monophosphatase
MNISAHSFPFTAVSIALLVNKKTEVAVIYNPILDEMFTARPGKGAFLNETKLSVSNTKGRKFALKKKTIS